MIVSNDILRKEIVSLLKQINAHITAVEREAKSMGIRPEQLRDDNGNWPMVPLLSAKVHAIATLAQLNTKESA